MVTATDDRPAKDVTVTVDMTINRITDQEFAADCKRVVNIGGVKMEPTRSSLQFSRVPKDYSQDILGTWEGRVSSSEGSAHDDGELHRWKNPGQPEMRESWEIDSIENGVMKWKALRTREDKTTYTATFQMTKVK